MKINFIKYLLLTFIVDSAIVLFIFLFDDGVVNTHLSLNNPIQLSFISILINNIKNYLIYLFLFPIWPLIFLMDHFTICSTIYFSITRVSLSYVLENLRYHGPFEIVNIWLYSYLSFQLFYLFWKDKSLNSIYFQLKKNKWYYMISLLLLVIAAYLEGTCYG